MAQSNDLNADDVYETDPRTSPSLKKNRRSGRKGNPGKSRSKQRNEGSSDLRSRDNPRATADPNVTAAGHWEDKFGKNCKIELIKESEVNGFIRPESLRADLNLKLIISIRLLTLQAMCFGTSIVRNGLECYKLTGRRNPREQIQVLAELFIYSFVQCYHAAIYGYTNPITLTGPIFRGHGWMFNFLSNGFPALYSTDGPIIFRNIAVNDVDHAANLTSLTNAFMSARVAIESVGPDGQLCVPFYENMAVRIRKEFRNLQGDCLVEILDGTDYYESPELSDLETSPLGSSFLADGSDQKLYVSKDESNTVFHDSIIFGKSLFITFNSFTSTYDDVSVSPPTFMSAYQVPETDPFIHREVELLTGMKCVPVRSLSDYSSDELPRTPDDTFYRRNVEDFGTRTWFRQPSNSN